MWNSVREWRRQFRRESIVGSGDIKEYEGGGMEEQGIEY